MICQIFGQLVDPQNNEIEMVVVRGSGPRRRPRGLLGHDPFDEAVGAVRKGRAVFADRAVDEAQVLKQHQLPVGVQTIQCFVPEKKIRFG